MASKTDPANAGARVGALGAPRAAVEWNPDTCCGAVAYTYAYRLLARGRKLAAQMQPADGDSAGKTPLPLSLFDMPKVRPVDSMQRSCEAAWMAATAAVAQ